MIQVRLYSRSGIQDYFHEEAHHQFHGEIELDSLPQPHQVLDIKHPSLTLRGQVFEVISEFVGDEVYHHVYVWRLNQNDD